MLDVAFDYNEYKFCSVKECDINKLYVWMKYNNDDKVSLLDKQILYRRFLEYYVTKDEFFVKILKENKLHGIIKGNINRDTKKELFLWLFAIDKEDRSKGEGKDIIEAFSDYICERYKLSNISVGVCADNVEALNFWKCIGFNVYRISEKFFQVSDNVFENLIVMNKNFV